MQAVVFIFVVALHAAVPNGLSPDVVISEAYGAGGNSGSDYPADYVELFHRGTPSCAANGNDTRIIDLVGYGIANYYEGAAPAQGATTTTATKRNAEGTSRREACLSVTMPESAGVVGEAPYASDNVAGTISGTIEQNQPVRSKA